MSAIDPRIVGTWRMKSTIGRDDAGQVLPPPYGPVAMGLVVFQADGRMMAVLCDGRASLPEGEPRQFMSYAGNYTFDGTTLSTRVDASSDASRVGGDQVRTVRFENGLMVLAPDAPPPGLKYEDLVAAVDVVVSKPGYGIVSECVANGTPLLYTSRGRFAEYEVMVAQMPGLLRCRHITQDDLLAGRWRAGVDSLLAQDDLPDRQRVDGAAVAARAILAMAG